MPKGKRAAVAKQRYEKQLKEAGQENIPGLVGFAAVTAAARRAREASSTAGAVHASPGPAAPSQQQNGAASAQVPSPNTRPAKVRRGPLQPAQQAHRATGAWRLAAAAMAEAAAGPAAEAAAAGPKAAAAAAEPEADAAAAEYQTTILGTVRP